MANFDRLLGAAARALGNSSSSSAAGRGGASGGSTDWRDMVRKVSDKVTGDDRQDAPQHGARQHGTRQPQHGGYGAPRQGVGRPTSGGHAPQGSAADRAALAKYDYLLQTAPPQQLEQVHRDAFERLTPEQRQQVLARLSAEVPVGERPASSAPADLARAATRGETAHPGLMKRVLGSTGGKVAAGAAVGAGVAGVAGLAVAVAGAAAVSSVALPLLSDAVTSGIDFDQLTNGFGFEGLGGLTAGGEEYLGGLGDQVGGLGDQVGGLGDQVGGFGEQLGNLGEGFQIPGLGNLFDR
ncbi:cation-transporting ATPase [Frigoribacterium sp. PhB24]|uniref:cation-transporting ATPase n=1 Tax=Frigoribacterium sp. PhB24 TaxID=2485204 RepID=UPI000F46ADF7|nr:cation-transporting ATPase [Frigoribacterium sp. PhB24]ROS48990.1 hypothetical protein EDF50_2778 [Frigoribacterium sp. PhB24]